MKKRLLVLLAMIVVLAIMLVPALAGSAEDDDDADGVLCYTPHLDEVAFYSISDYAGEKAFASTVETAIWTGTYPKLLEKRVLWLNIVHNARIRLIKKMKKIRIL